MDTGTVAVLVPIFAIVGGFSVAIVAIVVGYREKMRRAELRHRERITALEKGIELPPDPEPDPDARRTGSLKRGLAGLFLGIVLYFALREVAGHDVAIFGLIPAALGVANLISHFAAREKRGNGAARDA